MITECIKCGYCCKKRPCFYGIWESEKNKCRYLTEDNLCELYDKIVLIEEGSAYPMFGCGCSSPLFNDVRDKKLKEIENKKSIDAGGE